MTKKSSQPKDIAQLVKQVMAHPDSDVFKMQLAKAARKDPARVLSTIIKYQHTQYQKEILHWKLARAEAKDIYNPRRGMLTDLYEDIELDAFIHGIVHNKRIFKISNKPFKIVNEAGKEQPEKTKLLRSQWFNDFLKLAMQSRFYGYTLIYFVEWSAEGRIIKSDVVPRRHVIPDKHIWTKYQHDLYGYDYTQPPFSQYMIGVGREDDLGLYEKAALLYILKKHSWQSWDEFEERFGIPIPIVKTASSDKKVLDQVEKWLRELSTGSYGIIPDGGELTVVETGKTDAHQVFFKKIEMAQMELEILFTGQLRETNKNGTYGKEAAKEEEAQELIEDDKTFIANVINDKLLPLLRTNGYPITDTDRFDWNDGEQLDPKARLDIFKGVKDLGFKVSAKQVSEELDVIIEGEVEQNADPNKKKEEGEDDKDNPDGSINAIAKMHAQILKIYNHV
jgi:hypothetical protein